MIDIEFSNFSTGYVKDEWIVAGINFSRQDAGITAISGENGSGKSTIVRGLAGQCITSGMVMINGIDICPMPTHHRVKAGLTIIPQENSVFPTLSVQENIALSPQPEFVRDWLQDFSWADNGANTVIGNLSGGQRQLFSIAWALSYSPTILVVDEPSAGVDKKNLAMILDALCRAGRKSRLIVIEHNWHVIDELTSDIMIVEDGQLAVSP